LIEAFQAAEDQPDVRIWGGSNLAAGSDSEIGSSFSWTALRDIAEPIVSAAFRKNVSAQLPRSRGDVARQWRAPGHVHRPASRPSAST
jgi:hypothetical protein